MDFNDLNSKLKRLYSSLGEQYQEDIDNNIVDDRKIFPDGHFEHHTTFGTNDPEKNQNLVMNVIHLIGSLKDIIKRKMTESGGNPEDYEKLINGNLSLALVTDLDNKDKHGDPLTKINRSGKDPKIVKIEQALHGHGITDVRFTTNLISGKTKLDSVKGDVKIVVIADVVDANGKLIMSLDKMLVEAVSVIENFIRTNKLT